MNDTVNQSPGERQKGHFLVRLKPDLARKIRVLAASLGVSTPEFVNAQLRLVVGQQLAGAVAEFAAQAKESAGAK